MALESCHAEIGLNSRQSTSLSEVSGAQWSSLENPGERLIIKSGAKPRELRMGRMKWG
jgi:hypothetical protein